MPENNIWTVIRRGRPLNTAEWLSVAECIVATMKPHMKSIAGKPLAEHNVKGFLHSIGTDQPQEINLPLTTRGVFVPWPGEKVFGGMEWVISTDELKSEGHKYRALRYFWGISQSGEWLLARIVVLINHAEATDSVLSVDLEHSTPAEIYKTLRMSHPNVLIKELEYFLRLWQEQRESLLETAQKLRAKISGYVEAAENT